MSVRLRGTNKRARGPRLRTPHLVAITSVLAVTAVLATGSPAAAGAASPRDGGATPDVQYGIAQQVCAAAPAGDSQCFAVRRDTVPQGTAGAAPFTVNAAYPTGPAHGYTPGDLLTAYGLTGLPANAGSGQTVALIDAYDDPSASHDLGIFDTEYGLPAETPTSFVKINQNGAASPLPAKDTSGWSVEESLDIEAVRGICNNCKILLVEANTSNDSDLAAGVASAVAAGATEVSNSYGGAEGTMTAPERTAESNEYNYPGVVITASTGDDGWNDWDYYNDGETAATTPEVPSSLPDVVATGGTALTLNANATRNTEAVWNEDGLEDAQGIADGEDDGATGGGCSGNFTAQGWQSNIAGFTNTGCGTQRLAADVSALADPYTGFDIYDSYKDGQQGDGGGWATYGGTSLSSPLISAMWALAGGAHGVRYPSLTLYGHANGSSSFYDVTKGYNTVNGVLNAGGNDWCDGDTTSNCSSVTNTEKHKTNPNAVGGGNVSCAFTATGTVVANRNQCTAAVGFDGPSGVGAPTGLGVFTPMTPTPSFAAPTGMNPGALTAFSGSATDPFPGGTISGYSWNWGDGSGSSTGASPSHTFASSGTYTVTLTATDSYGQVGTVSHNVSVALPAPTVTSVAPSTGPTGGGTSVTINGTNFTGATGVKFGTAAATGVTVNSATSITATAPAHTAGTVDVTVTTPSGTSTTGPADVFTFLAPTTHTNSDFSGDGKTDLAVFRASGGLWYVKDSTTAALAASVFGAPGDIPVPGDYDGDGKTDLAVWRPGPTGTFYVLNSSTGTLSVTSFGTTGDIPVPGDYDGDGKTDLAVWRPGPTGTFYVLNSSTGTLSATSFGTTGDIPVPGDYDGDGKTDLAVWRLGPTGTFYVLKSSTGTLAATSFGTTGDIPVPGDYDGDGKTDLAVWRPGPTGTFYVLKSSTGTLAATSFGTTGDIPVPGDYDGDGKTDLAVWRPGPTGTFYVLNSATSTLSATSFGTTGDIPTATTPADWISFFS